MLSSIVYVAMGPIWGGATLVGRFSGIRTQSGQTNVNDRRSEGRAPVLRKIYGAIQDENGIWRSRRMNWVGHVMRMEGGRIHRRILEWKQIGRRIRGRPRKR
jgi:hypothetical protein